MKFEIYCEECDSVFENADKLERMINCDMDFDTLCCPYCNSDTYLRLIIDKEPVKIKTNKKYDFKYRTVIDDKRNVIKNVYCPILYIDNKETFISDGNDEIVEFDNREDALKYAKEAYDKLYIKESCNNSCNVKEDSNKSIKK